MRAPRRRPSARADAARRRERQAAETSRANELAQLRAERDAAAKHAEDARIAGDVSRPLEERTAAMRRIGIAPKDVLQSALRADSPEAQFEAMIEKRVGPVLSELEQLRAWKAESDAREAQARQQRAGSELAKVIGDATKYPKLSAQPPAIVLAAAREVWGRLPADKRVGVTDHDVFEYLEEQYAAHTTSAATATNATAASETPTGLDPGRTAGSATPRTITNDLANPRLASGMSFDALSLEEQKAEMARQLRERSKK